MADIRTKKLGRYSIGGYSFSKDKPVTVPLRAAMALEDTDHKDRLVIRFSKEERREMADLEDAQAEFTAEVSRGRSVTAPATKVTEIEAEKITPDAVIPGVIDTGAAEAPADETTTPVKKPELSEGEKLEAIRTAVANLDLDTPGNFTAQGLPNAVALTKALGWTVTSDMRNKAMGANNVLPDATEKAETAPKEGGLKIIKRGGDPDNIPPVVEADEDEDLNEGDETEIAGDPTTQGGIDV